MVAKKPAKKEPAKRKPAKKKPVAPKPVAAEPWPNWRRHLTIAAASIAMLGLGGIGGWWSAGGIQIGPDPVPIPVPDDVLSQAYAADRATQVAVIKELALQPFDGKTDDGRRQAGIWFNAQRFRNKANDFGGYTDAVSEAIAANAEAELAAKLEAAK
jgi:hypothetical protein